MSGNLTKTREEIDWRIVYSHFLHLIEKDGAISIPLRLNNRPPNSMFFGNDWSVRINNARSQLTSRITNQKSPFVSTKRQLEKNIDDNVCESHMSLSKIARKRCNNQLADNVKEQLENLNFSRNLSLTDFSTFIDYDLDENDLSWISCVNNDSKNFKINVTRELLRFSIYQLERLWYLLAKPSQMWLTKRQPTTHSDEDFICDICHDSETTSENIIVICESCDVAVHQECYGIPLIPEGAWLCRKCHLDAGTISCVLCPWKNGSFKRVVASSQESWCHVGCALMLPNEVDFLNMAYKEPIDISRIDSYRWSLVCQLCCKKIGAPVQCSEKNCHFAVHTRCAIVRNLYINFKECTLKCWKHSSISTTCDQIKKISDSEFNIPCSKVIHNFFYFKEPIACKLMVDLILEGSKKYFSTDINETEMRDTINTIARYWSLKRASKRGSPLVKKFTIEQWGHDGLLSNINQSVTKKKKLLNNLILLDSITTLVREREESRLMINSLSHNIFNIFKNPLLYSCRIILNDLKKFDAAEIFHYPVDPELVPDYLIIIKNPMDFTTVSRRISMSFYETIQLFSEDLELIFSNAILYNKSDTIYFKFAHEYIERARNLLSIAKNNLKNLSISTTSSTLSIEYLAGFSQFS